MIESETEYSRIDKVINEIIPIYDVLSTNMFSSWEILRGKKSVYPLAADTMMSVQNTLKSIRFCLKNGAISDANVLIRKYRDDLLQYLFVLKVVKESENAAPKFSIESIVEISDKDLIDAINRFMPLGDDPDDKIRLSEAWANSTLSGEKKRRVFFDASKYENNLSQDDKIKYIFDSFQNWGSSGDLLNNYVHTNGIQYLRDNYNPDHRDINTKKSLDTIVLITNVFLCILSILDSRYFMSSDYIDYLEVGEVPPEGSQYWVASCILNYFGDNLDTNMLDYIQNNQDVEMRLKKELYDDSFDVEGSAK